VYFIALPFLFHKIFTVYINDVLLFKCPFPRPKVNDATKHTNTPCGQNAGFLDAAAGGAYSCEGALKG